MLVMTSPDDDFRSFENLVHARDWEAIESWRSRVRPEHVAPLVALYDRVGTWDERCAVLQLLQDSLHPDTRRCMHHFLSAPNGEDENFELTKAIAVCHLDRDLGRFVTYLGDRAKLAADVAAWRLKTVDQ